MLGTYDRLCFGEFVGGIGCTPMSRGCLAVRGCMVGTLVIGSYIYHSDVIVTSTQIYVNRILLCNTHKCIKCIEEVFNIVKIEGLIFVLYTKKRGSTLH